MSILDIEQVRERIIKTDTTNGMAISCQPGDATLYELAIQKVDGNVSSILHEHCIRGWFVANSNLVGGRPRVMYVRDNQHVTWRDVREELGVHAEGSAYVITLILACVIGTRYDIPERFIQSLQK